MKKEKVLLPLPLPGGSILRREGEEMREAEVVVVVMIALCCGLGQNSLHMLRPISEKK